MACVYCSSINMYSYWDRTRAWLSHLLVDIKCFTHCLLCCLSKTKQFVNKTIYFPKRLYNQVKHLTEVKGKKFQHSALLFGKLLLAIVTHEEPIPTVVLCMQHFSVNCIQALLLPTKEVPLIGNINTNTFIFLKDGILI